MNANAANRPLAVPMVELTNGLALPRSAVPELEITRFQSAILEAVRRNNRVVSLFGVPHRQERGALRLYVLLADDRAGKLKLASTAVTASGFPSLTPRCSQVHLFEREIAEQWGIVPHGHPWLKPVRFHRSYTPGLDAWNRPPEEAIQPGVMNFYEIGGGQVHEVAVGPIHAGIIEPGHFRFQCDGENILHLEIALGYQHRGVERALSGGPNNRSLHYAETLAGDTTIGHASAYAQNLESLAACSISARAQALRAIALELERLANHVGDLGALSNDVGFLPTASFCGRIRGDFLNMSAAVCGNRFGRGLVRPGGVAFDVDAASAEDLVRRLDIAERESRSAINLLWETSSVMARFEGIGAVPAETAVELGLVGPAARAGGLDMDVRRDHPWGMYRLSHIPVATWQGGDVFARAYVRWLEVQQSIEFVREQLHALPGGNLRTSVPALQPDAIAVALVEAWRGELCHIAMTDAQGRLEHYKIVDPSFHNWMGVAMAVRGKQISDFPLCNKSFSLSYCGHDL
ncbi:MAG: NADH-quinone oxidoreductase subunit C [Phycisphaerae bacterium]